MINYPRITSAFYLEPWAIRPDVHGAMGQTLRAALDGGMPQPSAQAPDSFQQRAAEEDHGITRIQNVAVVSVQGVIAKHLSLMERMCTGAYDLAQLEQQMLVLEHSDATAIVLAVNSPGGIATGVAEAASMVQRLGGGRRVVAYIDGQACSAAYWLAASCGEIYAGPSSIVGSIGAYIAAIDDSRRWEMQGLKLELFRSGDRKALGIHGREFTDDDRAYLQERVDRVGAQFRAHISARRPQVGMDSMNGAWWDAEEGIARGLVDGLRTSIYDLISELVATGPAV
jgi:ClpP class serine protease